MTAFDMMPEYSVFLLISVYFLLFSRRVLIVKVLLSARRTMNSRKNIFKTFQSLDINTYREIHLSARVELHLKQQIQPDNALHIRSIKYNTDTIGVSLRLIK